MAQGAEQTHDKSVADEVDAIELYFERGVTDGLPVVPPTEARMEQRYLIG